MKQTAIEWILNKVWDLDDENFTVPNRLIEMLEQAKEMEKEQIEKAVVFGNRQDFYDGTEEIGSNYYNLTYTQSSE